MSHDDMPPLPPPVLLTVHTEGGRTREYLDLDLDDPGALVAAFLSDYLPTFKDNRELARRMQAGEKPLKVAGDAWVKTLKGKTR